MQYLSFLTFCKRK